MKKTMGNAAGRRSFLPEHLKGGGMLSVCSGSRTLLLLVGSCACGGYMDAGRRIFGL